MSSGRPPATSKRSPENRVRLRGLIAPTAGNGADRLHAFRVRRSMRRNIALPHPADRPGHLRRAYGEVYGVLALFR